MKRIEKISLRFFEIFITSFNRKFNKRKTGSEKWIIEFSFDYAF